MCIDVWCGFDNILPRSNTGDGVSRCGLSCCTFGDVVIDGILNTGHQLQRSDSVDHRMFVYLPRSTIGADNILNTLVMPAVETVTNVTLVHPFLARCGTTFVEADNEYCSFDGAEVDFISVSQ